MKDLGSRIRAARVKNGMTQEKLAELLNVSRVTIGKYESGEIEPKLQRLVEIAEILNVSSDDLLGIELKDGLGSRLSPEARSALSHFVQEVLIQYNAQKDDRTKK